MHTETEADRQTDRQAATHTTQSQDGICNVMITTTDDSTCK